MSFIDDAMKFATMPVPGPRAPDPQRQAFDAMSTDQLAVLWRANQHIAYKDQTEESWAAGSYFDTLPHEAPERALEMALAVLRAEDDTRVAMQLGGKFMCALINQHAATLIERLEAEAAGNDKLRWLLGAVYWWASDDGLKARLERIADIERWRIDCDERDTPDHPIDFTALTLAQTARVWTEQHRLLEKDRDNNWHALADFERDLRDENPDAALDLILEILKIETNPMLLSLLAAGPLEDVVGRGVIDRVERLAAADPAFRELLGGIYYYSEPEELRSRLDAILVLNKPAGEN